MGAFNAWVKGSFLEHKDKRRTDTMAMNIMYGASRWIRCQWLKSQGIDMPAGVTASKPLPLDEIQRHLEQ
jgi:hypothetical protein